MRCVAEQCVAVQYVAVWCSVLQCIAVIVALPNMPWRRLGPVGVLVCVGVSCNTLQCVAE